MTAGWYEHLAEGLLEAADHARHDGDRDAEITFQYAADVAQRKAIAMKREYAASVGHPCVALVTAGAEQ